MTTENDKKTPFEIFPKLKIISQQWTQCADCNDKHPKWAEIDRGILICLQCSGVHRSLGTHCSKVRSITLDNWTQEWVDNMHESNDAFNAIWEYHVDEKYMKPTSKTRRDIRTKYIKAKYIGIEDYNITKKLIPAFHKDQFGPKCPTFASDKYDQNDGDEKQNDKSRRTSVGMVQYTGVIKIYVMRANDLPKADTFSDSDPYVVFENSNGQKVKTKVIDDNNNPTWNEHLVLSVHEDKPVSIQIFDEDTGDDDLLCTASLNIGKQCKNGQEAKFNMPMKVARKKWQKNNPTLKFNVVYDKMDAQ